MDELILGARLQPRRLPLCPELSLWLLGDDVDLEARVADVLAMDVAPYWAFCWGSGQALARYVLDRPELVRGLRVVDFGAGAGVAALAARASGAREVVAVDLDPRALRACEENARLNGLSLEVSAQIPEEFDVLLASDVLYEADNYERLRAWSAAGKRLLVGDPLRAGNRKIAREPDARFEVRALPDVDRPITSAVVYELAPGALTDER